MSGPTNAYEAACAEIDRLRAEIAEALSLLRRVEWEGWHDEPCCLVCDAPMHREAKRRSHEAGCPLGILLAAHPEVKP